MNDRTNSPSNDTAYQVATGIAAVAGVVVLVVAALLLYDYSRRQAKDPLDDAALKALVSASALQPQNEPLKEQVRIRDLQVRREYFRHRAFVARGTILLLFAAAVFVLALKVAATRKRRLPRPGEAGPPVDFESLWTPIARWAVVAFCVVLVGIAVTLALTVQSDVHQDRQELAAATVPQNPASTVQPQSEAPAAPVKKEVPENAASTTPTTPPAAASAPVAEPATASAAASEPPPSDEEVRKMWPRFRGPDGSGYSAYTNVPDTWDGPSGKNIRWKTPVPLPGNNSPVVWGKRVFLAAAEAKRREVYCFDADNGKLLWQQAVTGTPQSNAKPPRVNEDTGFAAPTVATDGRRVFAIFANGDLAAFDVGGKPAWAKSFGLPENAYGYASSLCIYKNLLIIQSDQGSVRKPKSKLLAFDSATGKPAWQTDRPVPNSWSSPIVIRSGDQDQIVTAADPWVIAYRPADGSEIWRAKCLRTDIGPSPVFCDGKVYVANDNAQLSAIRADGKGDVTETHIAWIGEDGMPDTCSPLVTKEYVFLLASFGTLTCYDAVKGKMLWEGDIEGAFSASPSLIGNRLYLQSKEGKAYFIEPNREKLKQVGGAELGEECVTSPAFQDGRIYLRGKDHLFCIGKP